MGVISSMNIITSSVFDSYVKQTRLHIFGIIAASKVYLKDDWETSDAYSTSSSISSSIV